uniref:Uncharacterized protein n=1 Tax=Physcomitrium patens TaxID=3218 RepID=A0A2K1KNM8_PHYPA|nr:hypothetical protein PHYPA_006282 [Physcomitrium patens]
MTTRLHVLDPILFPLGRRLHSVLQLLMVWISTGILEGPLLIRSRTNPRHVELFVILQSMNELITWAQCNSILFHSLNQFYTGCCFHPWFHVILFSIILASTMAMHSHSLHSILQHSALVNVLRCSISSFLRSFNLKHYFTTT